MERWTNRVVLITGASEGIGRALALRLANHGMRVVGCARNEDRIKELASQLKPGVGTVDAMKCDLRNDTAVMEMFKKIKEKYGRLDVCINNAGLGIKGSLLDCKMEDLRTMTDVNVLALCLCSREAVKLMRNASVDEGYVININSMSGHRVILDTALPFYAATKFAVTALTEALRSELYALNANIRVSQISPGMVKTEFLARAENTSREEAYDGLAAISADDIAKAVEYILSTPKDVQIHDILVRATRQKP